VYRTVKEGYNVAKLKYRISSSDHDSPRKLSVWGNILCGLNFGLS